VGFLGFGRIAQATLARLVPFGITHCVFTSNPSSTPNPAFEASIAEKFGLQPATEKVRRVELDELARESDVLIVLAPGGEKTRHTVNEGFLKKMKKTAVLVNTARGTVVDSDALARALREGWIWGAGLDVVEGEPHVPADHPLVKEPRAVVLPHLGSATTETRLGMATLAAKNLLGGLGLLDEGMPAELDLKGRS
jgi:glyoxylate/hydroxypyruvate reductase